MLKLFDKRTGKEIVKGDKIFNCGATFVDVINRSYVNAVAKGKTNQFFISALDPAYKIRDEPIMKGVPKTFKLFDKITGKEILNGDIIFNGKYVLLNVLNKHVIRVSHVATGNVDILNIASDAYYETREITNEPVRIVMKADKFYLPGSTTPIAAQPNPDIYTSLTEALERFFDAGYTAKRIFDHDRKAVRSVKFSKKEHITLIAHIEIINGKRYIKNSIFSMLSAP